MSAGVEGYLLQRRKGKATAPKLRLTEKLLSALPVDAKVYRVHDDQVPGLSVRVWPSGKKVLELVKKQNGKPVTVRLGAVGEIPLAGPKGARARAQKALADISAGINPNTARKVSKAKLDAESFTLEQALSDYLYTYNLSAKTAREYEATLRRYVSDWLPLPLARLTPAAIQQRHRTVADTAPVAANALVRVLRLLVRHGHRKFRDTATGLSPLPDWSSDTMSRRWKPEKRRRRYIEPADLSAWWAATAELKNTAGRDLFRFLLLTGLRVSEAKNMTWDMVNMRAGSLHLPSTKSGESLDVPLNEPALAILRERHTQGNPHPFPLTETKHLTRKVVAACGVDFSPHDLRRSFISYAALCNVASAATKALVNHAQPEGSVTDGYMVFSLDTLREPAERIGAFILHQVETRKADVVELKKADFADCIVAR